MENRLNEVEEQKIYKLFEKLGLAISDFEIPTANELPDINGRYLIIYKADKLLHFNFAFSQRLVEYSYFPCQPLDRFKDGSKPYLRAGLITGMQTWLELLRQKIRISKENELIRMKSKPMVFDSVLFNAISDLPVDKEILQETFDSLKTTKKEIKPNKPIPIEKPVHQRAFDDVVIKIIVWSVPAILTGLALYFGSILVGSIAFITGIILMIFKNKLWSFIHSYQEKFIE